MSWWAWSNHTSPLNMGGEAREVREIQSGGGIQSESNFHLALKMEGAHVTRTWEQPPEAEGLSPGDNPERKWDPSPTTSRINSANNLNELGSGFFPRTFRRNIAWLTPWFQLNDTLNRERYMSSWTSDI